MLDMHFLIWYALIYQWVKTHTFHLFTSIAPLASCRRGSTLKSRRCIIIFDKYYQLAQPLNRIQVGKNLIVRSSEKALCVICGREIHWRDSAEMQAVCEKSCLFHLHNQSNILNKEDLKNGHSNRVHAWLFMDIVARHNRFCHNTLVNYWCKFPKKHLERN